MKQLQEDEVAIDFNKLSEISQTLFYEVGNSGEWILVEYNSPPHLLKELHKSA